MQGGVAAQREKGTEMTKAQVKTEQFEWAHGRKPRGYGMWAFELKKGQESKMIFVTANYAEARANAQRQASDFGASIIVVGA